MQKGRNSLNCFLKKTKFCMTFSNYHNKSFLYKLIVSFPVFTFLKACKSSSFYLFQPSKIGSKVSVFTNLGF